MTESLDPYLQWLGIRDAARPPNHYKLLGLELFEADPAVISNAADRQMAHVRTFQTGAHAEVSQRMLNELAAARVCLLKPDRKAAYDEQLRGRLSRSAPKPALSKVVTVASTLAAPSDGFADIIGSSAVATRRRKKSQAAPSPAILIVPILLVVAGIGWLIFGRSSAPETAARTSNQPISNAPEVSVSDDVKPLPIAPDGKPTRSSPNTATSNEASPAAAEIKEPLPIDEPLPIEKAPSDEPEVLTENDPGFAVTTDEEVHGDEAASPTEPTEPAEAEVAAAPEAENPSTDAPAAAIHKKLPLPSAEAQKAATLRVREIFKSDLAGAKGADAQIVLANLMLEQAAQSTDDAAAEFALLAQAETLATSAGDLGLLHQVIDRRAERFATDGLAEKVAVVMQLNKQAKTAAARSDLVSASGQLFNDAMAAENFAAATMLSKFILQHATKSRDKDAIKEAVERHKLVKESQKMQDASEAAAAKLKQDPADGDAHLKLGQYLSFVRGKWNIGLVHLSKSSDADLKAIATRELAKPTEPNPQKVLADSWMKYAGTSKSWEAASRAGAKYWYTQAVEGLTGLAKTEVDKRLEELNASDDGQSPSSGKSLSINLAPNVRMMFVRLPAGKFLMGSPPNEPGRLDNELQHPVTISKPFYLGTTEVTQAQWEAVMGSNPSSAKQGGNFPVDNVSRDDCQQFCEKLQSLPGGRKYKFRLPTEAEWEYACRAGSKGAYCYGDDPNMLGQCAWYRANSGGKTHPAGQLKPNAFGLFDMHGNVSEWCATNYHAYTPQPQVDPLGPEQGSPVFRGIDSRENAEIVRSARRSKPSVAVGFRHPYLGLRVVLIDR